MPLSNPSVLTGIDGWVDDSASTWTYASASTFTVSGDVTAKFTKGTRLKWTQTTVKYGVVVASSYGAPNTTVTITGGTDYTLANAAISANYYSYAANPQGYPGWFNYTPVLTGFSGSPSSYGMFAVVGKTCQVIFYASGTSNATGFTVGVPIVSSSTTPVGTEGTCYGLNNGTSTTSASRINLQANASAMDLYTTNGGAAWTASGTKTAHGQLFYFI